MPKPKAEPSRQRLWQIKQNKAGRCAICAGVPLVTKTHCAKCRKKNQKRVRDRIGCKKWKPGGIGRPPLEFRPDWSTANWAETDQQLAFEFGVSRTAVIYARRRWKKRRQDET